MDLLIVVNAVVAGWAILEGVRAFRRATTRRWIIYPAILLASYLFLIYSLSIVGVIPENDIRYFMRWFQIAVSSFIILVVRHV